MTIVRTEVAGDQYRTDVGEQLADLGQRLVVERQHADPLGLAALAQRVREHPGRRHVLDLGLDGAAHRVEHFLEDRHPLAQPRVQSPDLGQRQVADEPRAVGGAVDVLVVHHDERPVLAQVQVEFDLVQAGGLCGAEGPQGVLRLHAHDPAVTDSEEAHNRPP